MFDYVYRDGRSESLDPAWEKELRFIGEEFKKDGMKWCVYCQSWGRGVCRCNF